MLASVLGMDAWDDFDDLAAVQLFSPVRTRFQTMSMLSSDFLGGNKSQKDPPLSRPTSVEWVVSPHYRIYYSGTRRDELADMISERRSVYHTYLGVAEALCVPRMVGAFDAEKIPDYEQEITCSSVVPMHTVSSVVPSEGSAVVRSGSLSHSVAYEPDKKQSAKGDHKAARSASVLGAPTAPRRFSGAVELIYDRNAAPFSIRRTPEPDDGYSPPARFVRIDDGQIVCLW